MRSRSRSAGRVSSTNGPLQQWRARGPPRATGPAECQRRVCEDGAAADAGAEDEEEVAEDEGDAGKADARCSSRKSGRRRSARCTVSNVQNETPAAMGPLIQFTERPL